MELLGLGHRRAGHAGQLLVHAEVVLEGDGGHSNVLPLYRHALLGLDGLVQPLGVTAAGHHAPGELIHYHHLLILHHVLAVSTEQHVRLEGALQVMGQQVVRRVVQVRRFQQPFLCQQPLDLGDALVGEGHRPLPLIDGVVRVGVQLRHQPGERLVLLRRLRRRPADDKRGARLVDEDVVHLVHDGIVERALHALRQIDHHVVPQVVEAELVIGAVGDVGSIRLAALDRPQVEPGRVLRLVFGVEDEGGLVLDGGYRDPQHAVDRSHPVAVTLRQVVVDGDDVHPFAQQGVQIHRQGGHQGLALPGLHLGDLALVQHDAADELDIEMALTQGAPGRLAHGGERLGQDVIQILAVFKPRPKLVGLGAKLGVGERLELRLQRVDALDDRLKALQLLLVGVQYAVEDIDHLSPAGRCAL